MKRLFTAVPTPFLEGKIDYNSFERLINFQINCKVDGIVVSGSTGEGHSLSKDEWCDLMKFALKISNNKLDIIAGIGFNISSYAKEYAEIANNIGIEYILATVPYYNKPQQEGIYKHFELICNAAKNSKIILYNVPGRTVTDMSNDTILKLASNFKNIVGIKDATGKLERVAELKNKLSNLQKDFTMLSGEDVTQIGFNAMGGKGVISVVSNIDPTLCRNIQDLTEKNDFKSALSYQDKLFDLSKAMFCETNPVPVKYALNKLGIFKSAECRLPLVELSEKSKDFIDLTLEKLEIKY